MEQKLVLGSNWYTHHCPHCSSTEWVKVRRTFFQRLMHRNDSRCYCLNCRKTFWKEKVWQPG